MSTLTLLTGLSLMMMALLCHTNQLKERLNSPKPESLVESLAFPGADFCDTNNKSNHIIIEVHTEMDAG